MIKLGEGVDARNNSKGNPGVTLLYQHWHGLMKAAVKAPCALAYILNKHHYMILILVPLCSAGDACHEAEVRAVHTLCVG